MGPTLPPTAIYYVEEPADITIRDGVVCCIIRSKGMEFEFRCRPNVLVRSVSTASRAYSDYVCRSVGQVVRLPQSRRRKH